MRDFIYLSCGVLIWAIHFTAIYGFTALACARGFGSAAPWVVGAATLAAGAATAIVVLRNLSDDFTRWMTAAIAAAALIAIVWEGIAALMVKPCV